MAVDSVGKKKIYIKIIKIFIAISLVVIWVGSLLGINFYYETEKETLKIKLIEYEKRDIKLKNMQETVETTYNITPYEARYYSIIFYDFSEKYGIPWEVYPALIRIESNFNSGVMSKERAKGITQVLEATGKTQAEKLGIPFNDATLWNCVLNMVIGFDYFSEGYAEKKDNLSKEMALKHAIKRYCRGPGYSNVNPDAKIYVREYKSTLWDEYKRVSYVYKGIQFDRLVMEDSLKQSRVKTAKFLKIIRWTKNKDKINQLVENK